MRKYLIINFFILLLSSSCIFAKADNVSFRNFRYSEIMMTQDSTTSDSIKLKNKRIIFPLFKSVHSLNSVSLNQSDIEKLDYRSIGEILSEFPFVFENNLGYLGQPNQVNVWGLRNKDISFNIDGIPQNRVWNNFQNVYDIQSEMIDSIVMVSLSQSFLYGNKNEYQSFLMYSKDHVQRKPFSRLRFYQAPNEEGFVSVYLNTFLFPRFIFSSEITNMSASPKNENFNNDFSNWQVNTKIRYLFSESINFILGYYFVKNQTELNGGAINNTSLFDDLQVSPVYPNRFQRNTINQISLNILADIIDSNRTDATIYYQNSYDEFKQNKRGIDKKIPVILNDNNSKRIGIKIIQNVNIDKYNFEFGTISELTTIKSPYALKTIDNTSWSIYAKANATFSSFEPEIFCKVLNDNSQNYFGIGGLVRINLSESMSIKSGYSIFQKPLTWIEKTFIKKDLIINVKASDVSFNFITKHFSSSITYFHLYSDKYSYPTLLLYPDSSISNETGKYFIDKYSANGFNISEVMTFWKIKLNFNLNYYINLSDSKVNSSPRYNGKFGMYYVDKLFNNNLDLIAGIKANFFAEKSFVNLDYEKGDMIFYQKDNSGKVIPSNSEKVKPNIIFDLYISGIIQKRANVFFIIENLLDTKYFLVNYYPMYSRGMRLGVNWKLYN